MVFFGKKERILFLAVVLLLIASTVSLAHEGEELDAEKPEMLTLDERLKDTAVSLILISSLVLALLFLIAIFYKNKTQDVKVIIFSAIVLVVLVTTFYVAGSTIYLNIVSETGGPVHWHADFEVWNCGQKLDFVNPTGLTNKVGSEVFHEHGDDRIHAEGVITDLRDVTLHAFFEVMGGGLEHDAMIMPTNDGIVSVNDGELCNNLPSKLQVFLYRVENPDNKRGWIYTQEKLADFEDYILAPYPNVPPGDCIIIEFAPEKERTEHMCETFELAVQRGDLSGG